jgi:hypothetical protein
MKLGGSQSRSGRGSEEKNSQPLPALEPPIIQPITQRYATDLSRLKYIRLDILNYMISDHEIQNILRFPNSGQIRPKSEYKTHFPGTPAQNSRDVNPSAPLH